MREPTRKEADRTSCIIFLIFGVLCFVVGGVIGYYLQTGGLP